MVDLQSAVGKKPDNDGGFQCVVAAALHCRSAGWLMHQRPEGKHHAGLWEFPGGKVEPGETPACAMIRELAEELGIGVKAEHCIPACFAQEQAGERKRPIVILLYTIAEWEGEPAAIEGGAIDWFDPAQIAALDKPPLDVELCARLFADQ